MGAFNSAQAALRSAAGLAAAAEGAAGILPVATHLLRERVDRPAKLGAAGGPPRGRGRRVGFENAEKRRQPGMLHGGANF